MAINRVKKVIFFFWCAQIGSVFLGKIELEATDLEEKYLFYLINLQ